jgi:(1->4)-alpha-D-glucan 1-alpha-D-glucosylmutase
MAFAPRIPTATYRLQFNRHFTFNDATAIIPYLHRLGISDIYSSPFFQSRPESDHGYDVSNHNELNAAIGSRKDFKAMVAALKERSMGQLADFVPNHMGITDPRNNWWMDVLENGPSSIFAPFFDIDWDPLKEQVRNKVLLPVLGDQYGKVLEKGEFHLEFDEGAFFLRYYDNLFPLNPRTYHFILRVALEKLGRYSDEDMYLELESILTALEYLPPRTDTGEDKVRERAREKEVIKRRISRLCVECPQVHDAIESALRHLEGKAGHPRSFDSFDKLLSAQAYRLSYWRVAAEEINYRRFFDVNELAAIRVEIPVVFTTIHKFLFELIEDGSITGVRIDHVDGLLDPKQYLHSLQQRNAQAPADSRELSLYVVVEKILSEQERLRSDWPVHGTTGYDFTTDVTQLLIDSSADDAFSRIYREFIDRYVHFESLIYEKKKLVMDTSLASDIEVLGHMLSELAERDRLHRDFTLDSLSTVVRELVACFPVYRTYITEDADVSEADRQVIQRAIRVAKRRNAAIDSSIFDFLRDILLLEIFVNFTDETRKLQLEFILKFQQCTSPIMAKGLEDTAFYIFNRLSALNEVGGNPREFGISPERFHERNRARLHDTPQTMLATTTHDTKRSEDVRARIAVLSEMPEQWQDWLTDWHKLTAGAKSDVDGELAPSANEEYLIYQTLLGTLPNQPELADETYVERMQQYLLKSIKESKVNSSWIQPRVEWEEAVGRFIADVLKPDHPFGGDILKAGQIVSWYGMLNSLSQTILKLTVPGVPDLYQGTELWDFTLVDPDNRRPVDYQLRQEILEEVQNGVATDYFPNWRDGKIKLLVTERLLHLRRTAPLLFQNGNYSSLYPAGSLDQCCVAFTRQYRAQRLLVIVPRLTTKLGKPESAIDWKETSLTIDDDLPALKDAFSGRSIKAGLESFVLNDLGEFPFAVFHNLETPEAPATLLSERR